MVDGCTERPVYARCLEASMSTISCETPNCSRTLANYLMVSFIRVFLSP